MDSLEDQDPFSALLLDNSDDGETEEDDSFGPMHWKELSKQLQEYNQVLRQENGKLKAANGRMKKLASREIEKRDKEIKHLKKLLEEERTKRNQISENIGKLNKTSNFSQQSNDKRPDVEIIINDRNEMPVPTPSSPLLDPPKLETGQIKAQQMVDVVPSKSLPSSDKLAREETGKQNGCGIEQPRALSDQISAPEISQCSGLNISQSEGQNIVATNKTESDNSIQQSISQAQDNKCVTNGENIPNKIRSKSHGNGSSITKQAKRKTNDKEETIRNIKGSKVALHNRNERQEILQKNPTPSKCGTGIASVPDLHAFDKANESTGKRKSEKYSQSQKECDKVQNSVQTSTNKTKQSDKNDTKHLQEKTKDTTLTTVYSRRRRSSKDSDNSDKKGVVNSMLDDVKKREIHTHDDKKNADRSNRTPKTTRTRSSCETERQQGKEGRSVTASVRKRKYSSNSISEENSNVDNETNNDMKLRTDADKNRDHADRLAGRALLAEKTNSRTNITNDTESKRSKVVNEGNKSKKLKLGPDESVKNEETKWGHQNRNKVKKEDRQRMTAYLALADQRDIGQKIAYKEANKLRDRHLAEKEKQSLYSQTGDEENVCLSQSNTGLVIASNVSAIKQGEKALQGTDPDYHTDGGAAESKENIYHHKKEMDVTDNSQSDPTQTEDQKKELCTTVTHDNNENTSETAIVELDKCKLQKAVTPNVGELLTNLLRSGQCTNTPMSPQPDHCGQTAFDFSQVTGSAISNTVPVCKHPESNANAVMALIGASVKTGAPPKHSTTRCVAEDHQQFQTPTQDTELSSVTGSTSSHKTYIAILGPPWLNTGWTRPPLLYPLDLKDVSPIRPVYDPAALPPNPRDPRLSRYQSAPKQDNLIEAKKPNEIIRDPRLQSYKIPKRAKEKEKCEVQSTSNSKNTPCGKDMVGKNISKPRREQKHQVPKALSVQNIDEALGYLHPKTSIDSKHNVNNINVDIDVGIVSRSNESNEEKSLTKTAPRLETYDKNTSLSVNSNIEINKRNIDHSSSELQKDPTLATVKGSTEQAATMCKSAGLDTKTAPLTDHNAPSLGQEMTGGDEGVCNPLIEAEEDLFDDALCAGSEQIDDNEQGVPSVDIDEDSLFLELDASGSDNSMDNSDLKLPMSSEPPETVDIETKTPGSPVSNLQKASSENQTSPRTSPAEIPANPLPGLPINETEEKKETASPHFSQSPRPVESDKLKPFQEGTSSQHPSSEMVDQTSVVQMEDVVQIAERNTEQIQSIDESPDQIANTQLPASASGGDEKENGESESSSSSSANGDSESGSSSESESGSGSESSSSEGDSESSDTSDSDSTSDSEDSASGSQSTEVTEQAISSAPPNCSEPGNGSDSTGTVVRSNIEDKVINNNTASNHDIPSNEKVPRDASRKGETEPSTVGEVYTSSDVLPTFGSHSADSSKDITTGEREGSVEPIRANHPVLDLHPPESFSDDSLLSPIKRRLNLKVSRTQTPADQRLSECHSTSAQTTSRSSSMSPGAMCDQTNVSVEDGEIEDESAPGSVTSGSPNRRVQSPRKAKTKTIGASKSRRQSSQESLSRPPSYKRKPPDLSSAHKNPPKRSRHGSTSEVHKRNDRDGRDPEKKPRRRQRSSSGERARDSQNDQRKEENGGDRGRRARGRSPSDRGGGERDSRPRLSRSRPRVSR